VVDTTITNFYYVNNGQYVDILLTNNGGFLGDNGTDNQIRKNVFSFNGTSILPVIPYVNTACNNPTKLQIWTSHDGQVVISYSHQSLLLDADWRDILNNSATITTIYNLPSINSNPVIVRPRQINRQRMHSKNLFCKPAILSTGSDGEIGRLKQRKT